MTNQTGVRTCVGVNIFYSGIKFTEKDWVHLKVQHYPLLPVLGEIMAEPVWIVQCIVEEL